MDISELVISNTYFLCRPKNITNPVFKNPTEIIKASLRYFKVINENLENTNYYLL